MPNIEQVVLPNDSPAVTIGNAIGAGGSALGQERSFQEASNGVADIFEAIGTPEAKRVADLARTDPRGLGNVVKMAGGLEPLFQIVKGPDPVKRANLQFRPAIHPETGEREFVALDPDGIDPPEFTGVGAPDTSQRINIKADFGEPADPEIRNVADNFVASQMFMDQANFVVDAALADPGTIGVAGKFSIFARETAAAMDQLRATMEDPSEIERAWTPERRRLMRDKVSKTFTSLSGVQADVVASQMQDLVTLLAMSRERGKLSDQDIKNAARALGESKNDPVAFAAVIRQMQRNVARRFALQKKGVQGRSPLRDDGTVIFADTNLEGVPASVDAMVDRAEDLLRTQQRTAAEEAELQKLSMELGGFL